MTKTAKTPVKTLREKELTAQDKIKGLLQEICVVMKDCNIGLCEIAYKDSLGTDVYLATIKRYPYK